MGQFRDITTKLMKHQIEWLGMLLGCLTTESLFGSLPQTYPLSGPQKKWRGVTRLIYKMTGICSTSWYTIQEQMGWPLPWRCTLWPTAVQREVTSSKVCSVWQELPQRTGHVKTWSTQMQCTHKGQCSALLVDGGWRAKEALLCTSTMDHCLLIQWNTN